MNMYQAGDCILKETKSVKGKALKTDVVLLSTPTGNPHTLHGGSFVIKSDGKDTYVEVKRKTVMKHKEHKDIELPKGKYVLWVVREYDHFKEEARRVVD